MGITRRNFIKSAAAVAMGFSGLYNLVSIYDNKTFASQIIKNGYGPLLKDPHGIFDMPKGFSYKIISRHGQLMDDGFYVPALSDGMAAFPGENGKTILIRNHEVNSDSPLSFGAFGKKLELLEKADIKKIYDPGSENIPALGGTTTLIFNTETQKVEKQYLSLAGTLRNCAGGPTPWNSWITCEETSEKANGQLLKNHGYCFEVPASSEIEMFEPVPLTDMGRFVHEAIAVDPTSGIVYLTEDREDSLIYRYIPTKKGKLALGGNLQALKITGRESLDTRNWETEKVQTGKKLLTEWIDMENVQSPDDDLRYRGFTKGAARFARGEGMWFGNQAVFFACTSGGRNKRGQIWKYIPSSFEGTEKEIDKPGYLELFIEPNDINILDMADNLTVSPWGDLIICEDGSDEQYIVGVTPVGEIYKFGKNALNNSELAGVSFSPDGSTLFFNLMSEGLTLAITGPWKKT